MLHAEFSEHLLEDEEKIRQEVFVSEQGFENEFDDIDNIATHMTLYNDADAVGCCRFFPGEEPGEYIIGRMAVRKAYRGQAMGRRILEMAIQHLKDAGASKISLSAQVQAKGFYETLGFQAKGNVYMDEHCPHIHMEKLLQYGC